MLIRILTVTIDDMIWISYRKPGEDWARAILSCDKFVEIAAEYLPAQMRMANEYFEGFREPSSWDICKFFVDMGGQMYTIQHYLLTALDCESGQTITEDITGFENAIARRDEMRAKFPNYHYELAYISDDTNPFEEYTY